MNYDRLILELMDRVSRLEEEVAELKPKANKTTSQTSPRNRRDTTKYILNGVKYSKSRLVLAIVRAYLDTHPTISASDLLTVFDKSLQGSLGVIRVVDDAQKSYTDYRKRFFCKPDEIINTTTSDCVVCSQWSAANIGNIIARAKELGINITVI